MSTGMLKKGPETSISESQVACCRALSRSVAICDVSFPDYAIQSAGRPPGSPVPGDDRVAARRVFLYGRPWRCLLPTSLQSYYHMREKAPLKNLRGIHDLQRRYDQI